MISHLIYLFLFTFLMKLLENLNVHMWLMLYFCWTMLLYEAPLVFLNILSIENIPQVHSTKVYTCIEIVRIKFVIINYETFLRKMFFFLSWKYMPYKCNFYYSKYWEFVNIQVSVYTCDSKYRPPPTWKNMHVKYWINHLWFNFLTNMDDRWECCCYIQRVM